MSSAVPKRLRTAKPPRLSYNDFGETEQAVIDAASSWYPGRICVFGSRASGRYADDSDLDLGVDGFQSHNQQTVRDYLSGLFGIRVDLRSYDSVINRKETVVIS